MRKSALLLFAALATTAPLAVSAATTEPPLTVAAGVDLQRYAGQWYEVARLPNKFQDKCVKQVTADYKLNEDGTVRIINSCVEKDGKVNDAEGRARLKAPGAESGKLEVRFAPSWLSWVPLVWEDYWVLDLDRDYQYSVVGTPDRKYFWILSRTPALDSATLDRLISESEAKGFKLDKVIRTQNVATETAESAAK